MTENEVKIQCILNGFKTTSKSKLSLIIYKNVFLQKNDKLTKPIWIENMYFP